MKRNLITILFIGLISIVIAACGTETTKISGNDNKAKDEVSKDNKENVKKVEKEATSKKEDIQEDENMKVTNTYTNKELGIKGTTGPLNYEISGVQLKKLKIKSEEAANLLEMKVGDVAQAVTIKMSGENTSDDDMNFYLGQATIITNTKEQLEPSMFLSKNIEGEYLGKVQHEGYNVYILKKSTVDDLKTIEIRVSAPTNSNFDTVGKEIKQVIKVNN